MEDLLYEIYSADINVQFFIFSIVFQVCGALILLISSFDKTKEQIVEDYFELSCEEEIDDDNVIQMESQKVAKSLQKIYNNRLSFIYLAFGYTLTILGDCSGYDESMVFRAVLILCIFILVFSYIITLLASMVVAVFRSKVKFKDVPKGAKIHIKTGESIGKDGEVITHIKTIVKK